MQASSRDQPPVIRSAASKQDAGGNPARLRHATSRHEAERRLRESERRFRLMADSIPQLIWILDSAGRAVFVNKQWMSYTGADLAATGPDQLTGFIHPADIPATLAAWAVAKANGEVFSVEHRVRSASGEYRWFLARAEPQRNIEGRSGAAVLRWFGTSTDVHDKKLAEAQLKLSEARYRSLFDSIDEGFCIIELVFDAAGKPVDYRFREINRAFAGVTGLPAAEGRLMRELVPEHEEFWFETYGKVALTGEPVRTSYEAKAMGRWFDLYAFRVDDPAECRVAILFKDVSAAKRSEEALLLADRRKDEFVAMLAHELRNPLAPISAAADLLAMGGLNEACLKQTGGVISRQVRHMTGLVDDLLDVSRVKRGLVRLRWDCIDAARVAADAVEQARPAIEAASQRLTVQVPPGEVWLRGDHKRLVQVMTNLLNNAAKYTPAGGEIVLRVEVESEAAQPQVRMTVRDNGVGMAPELLERAFELFAQGEQDGGHEEITSGGLGIGLALVKSLVELHHGSVAAHSAGPGCGSSFTVCLPLEQAC
ncbi:ATP-binding protein [Pseudoduganella sp. LjRoot289]|uniref:PAS domain-containing sensor histidine kinase n=1 Tax=Pseudoduganella sp. LjRoot289 TaxID=3342314 RepID=UPI003ECED8AF